MNTMNTETGYYRRIGPLLTALVDFMRPELTELCAHSGGRLDQHLEQINRTIGDLNGENEMDVDRRC